MKKSYFFILLTTAAWAAVCFFKVHASADPSGGDGYFYLKQTEYLVDHLRFYHADYSFIFFPLALLYKITGSSLLAYQLLTTLSLSLMMSALGTVFYDRAAWIEKTNLRILAACTLTVLFGLQASLLKLGFEFAKNGFAQGLLLWGLCYYFRGQKKRGILLMALSSLTHKLVFIFFLLFLVVQVIDLALQKGFVQKKRTLFAGAIALGLAMGGMLILFPRLLSHVENFVQHFSFEKSFFMQIENQLMSRLLMALTFSWLLFALLQLRKQRNAAALSLVVFSLLPYLPLFSGYNTEIKYRLFLLSFTFGAVLFALALATLRSPKVKVSVFAFTLLVLAYQATEYNGFPWIVAYSERIKNLDQLIEKVPPGSELVTHHGLQFYIDYKTPIRARSMISAQRKPEYQIAYTPTFYHLNDHISDEIHQIEILSLGETYALFEYDDFQNLMHEYPLLSDWRNQFQLRPDFVQDY